MTTEAGEGEATENIAEGSGRGGGLRQSHVLTVCFNESTFQGGDE